MKRLLKRNRKKQSIKTVIRILIIIILIVLLSSTAYGIYKENKIKTLKNTDISNISIQNSDWNTQMEITDGANEKKEENAENDELERESVQEEYEGFKVTAKLEIPKIDLITNVLADYSKEALDVCATKFWGPEPNEVGNFCIVGHNYEKDNMFNNLKNLEINDDIYLVDNKNGKNRYVVYDIYKVSPNNIAPLAQETNQKKEITLITCTNYSNKRLIVKGRQVNNEGDV